MSVTATVRCFGLCDKPWTWSGRRRSGPNTLRSRAAVHPRLFLTLTVPLSATLSPWMPKTLCGNTSVEQVSTGRRDRREPKKPQKNKTWHQIWTEVDRLDILQAEKNTVNPRQSKCTSGITFNKPLQTKCYMLKNNSLLPTGGHHVDYEEQASKVRASTRLSMAPNAGSESVMAVRGADMWAFGRGEKRPVAAEIQRGNKDGGGRGSPERFLRTQQGPVRPRFTPTLGQPGANMATVQWEAPLSS